MSAYRIRLFSYGTLQDPKVQMKLFGRLLEMTPATLKGWRIVTGAVLGKYSNIVRDPKKSAVGVVVRINKSELAKSDEWEEVPTLYRRIRVTAHLHPQLVRCWVYIASQ